MGKVVDEWGQAKASKETRDDAKEEEEGKEEEGKDANKLYGAGTANMTETPMRTDITVVRTSDGKFPVTPEFQKLIVLEHETHGAK